MSLPTNIVSGQAGHAQLHNDVNTAVNALTLSGASGSANVPTWTAPPAPRPRRSRPAQDPFDRRPEVTA
jgi:hypothetical protein